MVFPLTYTSVLLVAIASLILGSVWALTVRAAGKWRFELLSIDFGLGVILGAVCIGFTLGTLGQEITVFDNLIIMRKFSIGTLVAYGALVNLGLILLLGAVSTAGMALAFLAGMSLAAVTAAIGMQLVQPLMRPVYLGLGSILLLAAVGLVAGAHGQRIRQRDTDLLQKAVAAGMKGKLPRTSPVKGLLLAVIGGLLIGLAQPVAIWAQGRDEIGFGAYAMSILIASAFAVGTPFFSLFFLNLPVQGEPLSFTAWFKGTARQHLLGLGGGWLWFAGLTALLLAATATPAAGMTRSLAFSLSRSSIIVGAVIGIFMNGEFANSAPARSRAIAALGAATAGLLVFALSRL
jgi:glucose uptake protein